MAHLNFTFPTRMGNGAKRIARWDVEIVSTDGGGEVRNSRWSEPLWTFEVPIPIFASDDHEDFQFIQQLWEDANGATHTFNFWDDLKQVTRVVRFEEDLQISDVVGPYRQFETIRLQEVR
jgi:hypothetical protein